MSTITERVDRHTHVPREKFILNPPFPDAIKIELTSFCNYRCTFCASKRSLRPRGNMDVEFLHRILREAKSIGVKEMGMFLLGESMILKDLADHIRYAKETVGIEYVFITTNGYLCTPEKMVPIIEAGLDSIKFSMNAGARDRYREMHNVDGFDNVVENIKWLHTYLKENKIKTLRTCVSSIAMPDHMLELDKFRDMISEYVDEFYYLPLYNQAGHLGSYEYTKIIGNPGRYANMVLSIPCWALFNAAKITWDGKLTACCFDHDTRFEIANLNDVTLLEAWNNEKFVEMRRQHLERDLKKSLCARCLGMEGEQTKIDSIV